MQPAVLILKPAITITAERVALVLGVPLDRATEILSRPDTRDIIQAALDQKFHETIDSLIFTLLRQPTVGAPPKRDVLVELPGIGLDLNAF
jgi:hypothetical protein